MNVPIDKKLRGIERGVPGEKAMRKFRDMIEDGDIETINKLRWPSACLPEMYVEARKKAYWLNILEIPDPTTLKRKSQIRLIKFGELIESMGPLGHYEDHYDNMRKELDKYRARGTQV